MRVEMQGMATDYRPAPVEADLPVIGNKKSSNEKVKVKELKSSEQQSPQQQQQPNKETVQEAISVANEAMSLSNHHLQFRLHEGSGRYQVKVYNSDTDEVIREIPAKAILEFSANIRKMLNDAIGILVDEKV